MDAKENANHRVFLVKEPGLKVENPSFESTPAPNAQPTSSG